MECPYCNTENRDGVRYCANCGRQLDQADSTLLAGAQVVAVPGSSSLTPGSRLQGGRYVIKKVLGQGGMGAALLATDLRLDSKPVVIKELISDNTDPAKVPDDVRNFKREVATLAHIDHPLVPNVTDHFQEGPRYFMVQEFVDGENLQERMDRTNQPMKERDALGYAWEVLDILDYLAQQNPPVVHRDIKPANIIIGAKDKRAHLVDFGIARADTARNAQRKQTSALGTPGYAPPEQYQGNADPRSDLYALGATLHYLLTNRDPRNHPPFVYSPVRSLNPQLSPETERVLNRALVSDINQRYQSAAAMKQDIYNILQNRYGVMGNASSYTLNTSGQMAAIGAAPTIANQPTWIQPPPPAQPVPPPPALPPYPYQPQPQPSGSHRGRNILLVLLAILLIVGVAYGAFTRFLRPGAGVTSTPTPVVLHGIGVTKAADGEYIGISDGTFAFDTNRPDGNLKRQAADRLKAGDISGAESLWQSGLQQDTSDAEALIYLENQRVLNSGNPHITLVAGTMITGDNIGVGRDDLQGAYIAQKEFNDGFKLPNNVQVILLVANSGNDATYATTVAQQIVQAAQQDHTIVGVMGWPFSSRAINVVKVLAAAHIPMVSQTASSDLLSQVSPYFFRVAPSNNGQGIAGAQYAEQALHAKNVALFVDPSDAYSSSLAADFSRQFKADGNTIVVTENYTVGASGRGKLPALLQDALNHNPDLIYFSGYSNDISVLLANLPTSGPFANLQILGGDALYELGGYPSSARVGFNRLHFTAFAYPDEWEIAGLKAQKPAFFTDYANAFNPTGQHPGGAYGYTRTDNDVMLSYDATLALLTGSKLALNSGGGNKKSITPDELRQGLAKITGAQALQGVSGRIAFGPDGNPVDKAFVILFVDALGRIHEESLRGCFQVGACT
jgi:serine/threonine protein kinase/ABC-type branched-subunit amino acid transport system substrate-binding protein